MAPVSLLKIKVMKNIAGNWGMIFPGKILEAQVFVQSFFIASFQKHLRTTS